MSGLLDCTRPKKGTIDFPSSSHEKYKVFVSSSSYGSSNLKFWGQHWFSPPYSNNLLARINLVGVSDKLEVDCYQRQSFSTKCIACRKTLTSLVIASLCFKFLWPSVFVTTAIITIVWLFKPFFSKCLPAASLVWHFWLMIHHKLQKGLFKLCELVRYSRYWYFFFNFPKLLPSVGFTSQTSV